MRPQSGHTPTRSLITCLWFWIWTIDGALTISALDVGAFAAGPALLLTALLLTR